MKALSRLALVLLLVLLGSVVKGSNAEGLNVCEGVCSYLNTDISNLEMWGHGLDHHSFYWNDLDADVFMDSLYRIPSIGQPDIYEVLPGSDLVYVVRFTQARSHREGPFYFSGEIFASIEFLNEDGLIFFYQDGDAIYVLPFPDMRVTCSSDLSDSDWLNTCGNHPSALYQISVESVNSLMASVHPIS